MKAHRRRTPPGILNQDSLVDGATITIAPDGTARCVWTETVPLHELGRLKIQRACSVEFDNEAQAWRVFDGEGDCLYCSPSRETCLAWERKHMNWLLDNS
jgi:hypothetical protein